MVVRLFHLHFFPAVQGIHCIFLKTIFLLLPAADFHLCIVVSKLNAFQARIPVMVEVDQKPVIVEHNPIFQCMCQKMRTYMTASNSFQWAGEQICSSHCVENKRSWKLLRSSRQHLNTTDGAHLWISLVLSLTGEIYHSVFVSPCVCIW